MNNKTHVSKTAACIASAFLLGCGSKPPVEPKTPVAPEKAVAEASAQSNIFEGALDNGLKVLVLEDKSAPVVAVQVWYKVGSRNERVGIRGIAHLTEHMMFKGSTNIGPEEHARIIDSVGGDVNAFTSDDVTAYHDTVPADRMDLAMELEAERMALAKLDESHFYKEREVVKEELRVSIQNNPIGALFNKFREVAFKQHPYSWTPIGTIEDLDKMTPNDLRNFYKTYYTPNNAVLIVVGDTTGSEVMELAKKYFGVILAGQTPPQVTAVEPEQNEYRKHDLVAPTQLPIIIGGYKIPEAANQDTEALEAAAIILGQGNSSRLHKVLVRDKRLAAFAGCFNEKMKDPGIFTTFVGYMPTISKDQIEKALIEEVDKLAKEGPTKEELTKAKNQLASQYAFKLASFWETGYEVGNAELVEGDYHRFFQGTKRYDRLTIDDVKRATSKYLTKNRLTVAFLLPPAQGAKVEKATATEIEQAKKETIEWPTAERFLKLSASSAAPIELPKIVRKTLDNGLKIMVIERREQPVVYFDMTVLGGKTVALKGKAGSAELMAEMLTHGTKTRSAEEIASQTETLGGSLNAYAGTESFKIGARFLSRDSKEGLSILADVAMNSVFASDEMDKAKQMLLADVKMTKDDPRSMAIENLNYLIFGYDFGRGRPASEQTMSSVTKEDLAAMHNQAFIPQNSMFTVTGDVNAEETIAAVEAVFGKWANNAGQPNKAIGEPKQLPKMKIRLVDKPDLTQSTIALGHVGIERKNADYAPLLLGNYILGEGGFSSRLMKVVRSKGGKTYGVRSRFDSGISKGPFFAYTFTRTSETGSTIDLILNEIKKIRKEGVTADELQAAKNNLAGSYAIALQTPDGMAGELINAEFFGLGQDWVRDYRKTVTTPTIEEVNAALKKHLSTDKIALVVVGSEKDIANQLKKLGKAETVDYLAPVPNEERAQTSEGKNKPKK